MSTVNIFEAKTQLSRLIEAVESGAEREIIIARNGRPAARLVPVEAETRLRLGLASGVTETPAPDPDIEKRAAALFTAGA
jgi:prevent-host-death family protein